MNSKFGKLRNGIAQPQLDDFVTASVCWTLEHKYPDLTLVHLVDLDSMRHHYGVESKEAIEALERLDTHLGMMLDSLKKLIVCRKQILLFLAIIIRLMFQG